MSMWLFTLFVLVAALGGGFIGWWARKAWSERAVPTWAGDELLDEPSGIGVPSTTSDAVTKPVNPARRDP